MGRKPMPPEIEFDIADRLRAGMETRVIAATFDCSISTILRLAKKFEIRLQYIDHKPVIVKAKSGQESCACGRSVKGKCVACAARAWRRKYGLCQ